MSKNIGTLVGATVRPADSADQYPVAWGDEILGGHSTLSRANVPTWLRKEGMTCAEAGVLYVLGADLVTWSPISGGGGSGSTGTWNAMPLKSATITVEDIDLEYRVDNYNDATKIITFLRGQIALNASYVGTFLQIGILPDGARPKGRLKRVINISGVAVYLIIETTGEVSLVSKEGFALPVNDGTSDRITIAEFYKAIPASGGAPGTGPAPTTNITVTNNNFTEIVNLYFAKGGVTKLMLTVAPQSSATGIVNLSGFTSVSIDGNTVDVSTSVNGAVNNAPANTLTLLTSVSGQSAIAVVIT